ncbi:MAG: ATP-binding protein [Deferrisomatales bacterium]
MKRTSPRAALRYAILAVLVSLVSLLGSGATAAADRPPAPLARGGAVDLTGWAFGADGSVDLNGEWELYWGQLLAPEALMREGAGPLTGLFQVPGLWNGREVDGRALTGDGFATFRLRVALAPGLPPLALRVLDQSSAYALWANGQRVAGNGVVGTSRATTVPQYLLQVAPLPPGAETLDLVLQVANFHHAKGGVWTPVTLGLHEELAQTQELKWGLDLFLFGSLLVMGAYHLCLYLLRRGLFSAAWFGLFCLVVAFRTLITENRFLTYAVPDFPFELLFTGELLTVHLAFLLLLAFLHSLYPAECSRRVLRLLQGLCVAFAVAAVATRARTSSLLVAPFHPIILLVLGYAVFVLVRAARRRRAGAASILGGLLVFVLAVVNDILHNHGAVATAYVAPFGFLFLVGSQSFALAQRFSGAFAAVERLSAEREEHIRALSRMDRLKDEFLANTSHELRTPLHGIIGLADALAAGPLPAAARPQLAMIAASGRRLGNLVNDILDLARLKNRDLALHRRAVDLRALVDAVLAVSRPLVQGRPLALRNEVPADLPAADGDEDRLQQVLFNLVGNALKFTDQGEVMVAAAGGPGGIEVSVRDTGPGIPADRLETIFDAFAQGDGSAARRYGGAGLGLGISRHLVELHGGRLWAESTPGQGSTFRFTLPAAGPGAGRAPGAPREPPPPPAPGSPRVLAVDDDPVNLEVVRSQLALEGLAVTPCPGGPEALARLEAGEAFDLVLLDVMMPGMTGYEVCRRLRHRYNAAELPVILLTARTRVEDLTEGLASGANDYLGKPFAREELLARVHAQLRVRRAHELDHENRRLVGELERRGQTELELRLIQRRLGGILHALPDRIVAVNGSREIAFCNQAFERRFGVSAPDLLGRPFGGFCTAEAAATVEGWLAAVATGGSPGPAGARLELASAAGPAWSGTVLPAALELEEERLLLLVLADDPGAAPSIRWADDLTRNRRRLQQLEETLNGLTPAVLEQHPGFLDDLRAVDRALERLARVLAPEASGQEQRRRIVETMQLALDLWADATQTDKAELARRSGQWSVYVNQDGWERTQTLDRYLALDTLPANPRLKKVLRTAEFVLEACPAPGAGRLRLAAAVESLRALGR